MGYGWRYPWLSIIPVCQFSVGECKGMDYLYLTNLLSEGYNGGNLERDFGQASRSLPLSSGLYKHLMLDKSGAPHMCTGDVASQGLFIAIAREEYMPMHNILAW